MVLWLACGVANRCRHRGVWLAAVFEKDMKDKGGRMKHVQTPRPMKENMNDAYFAMTGGIWNSRKPVPGVFTA